MTREFIVFIGTVVGIPLLYYLGKHRLTDDEEVDEENDEDGPH